MNRPTPRRRSWPGQLAGMVLALALVLAAGVGGPVPAAHAAASVNVSSSLGSGLASATGTTAVTVSGSGFQSIPNAMGGIYVMFGTVTNPGSGGWRPSQGGSSGTTYFYVPDSESASNHGYQRFVTFPGSTTASEANGGQLAADGTWSTQMVIPGPVFTAVDRAGNSQQVDCRTVRCGIITIGAHGITNANNETFTPLTFTGGTQAGSESGQGQSGGAQDQGSDQRSTGSQDQSAADTTGGVATGTSTDPAALPSPTAPQPGQSVSGQDMASEATDDDLAEGDAQAAGMPSEVIVGVDTATSIVGRAMSFSARGFEPGEQVTATLDDGLVAVGPLLAGGQGEVGGILQLPADLRVGTHTIKVSGAASGREAITEIVVSADPLQVASATEPPVTRDGWDPAWVAAALAAALLLTLLVLGLIGTIRRRRATKKAETKTTAGEGSPANDTLDPVGGSR